jgi:CubicO group peptidase (beta-lactamase class C family)
MKPSALLGLLVLLGGCALDEEVDVPEEAVEEGVPRGLTLKNTVDLVVSDHQRWDKWLVVGAITPTESAVFYYTSSGLVGPTADHAFRLGSVSKTFTGMLAALQDGSPVDRGGMGVRGGMMIGACDALAYKEKARLSVHLAEVCPTCGSLPWPRDTIQVEQLLTHRSGLPHQPTETVCSDVMLFRSVTRKFLWFDKIDGCSNGEQPMDNDQNPGCEADKLCWTPGQTYNYGNYSFELVGQLLAARANMGLVFDEETAFDKLNRSQILTPLGMTHTYGGSESVPLQAPGWNCDVLPCTYKASFGPSSYLGTPAGGMWSTGPDMLIYLRFMMSTGSRRLLDRARPLVLCDRSEGKWNMDANGDNIDTRGQTGLGWDHLELGPNAQDLIWRKLGGTNHYAAYIAFKQAKGVGIFVLSNTNTSKVEDIGNDFLSRY